MTLSQARRDPAPVAAHAGQFRALAGEPAWNRLPAAVRARFERGLAPGESAAFVGEIAFTRMHWLGRCWAQIARLAGAPLPLRPVSRRPAVVLVTQEPESDAQHWTRVYHEPGRLPQVIRSTKCFAGPTGLEECVGAGIGMALVLSVEERALVFRTTSYFWRLFGRRIRIPDWLTPGRIEVIHREERAGQFSFTLIVTHAWAGEIIRQVGFFRDAC